MEINYEVSIEEAAYCQFRAYELEGNLKKLNVIIQLVYLIISIFIAYGIFFLANFPWELCVGGVVSFIIYKQLLFKRSIKNMFKRSLIKTIDTNGPLITDLCLSEDRVGFTRFGQTASFQWDCCIKVTEEHDKFELIFEPFNAAFLFKRVFGEDELRELKTIIARKLPTLYSITD